MEHRRFDYKTTDDLRADIERAGVNLPVSEDLSPLKETVKIGEKSAPNALGIHPMEGCDGTADGAPAELTFRRYDRFARGGAGLLWLEACAVTESGRANPRQISIKESNLSEFKKLRENIISAAAESMGEGHRPYTVLQLTHSGRYSRPYDGAPAITAVGENPYIDPYSNPNRKVITDEELDTLKDDFVRSAKLAREAGFDAVDVKACHRYLNSELLSAFTRENSRYGGSFENRTRLLCDVVDKIRAEVDIDIAVRLNAYDAIPYPYGWGSDKDGNPDLTEPKRLMKILAQKGVKLVNISAGNPYYNPHIGRPCDIGPYVAPEHQIESAARILNIVREMKSAAPEITVMGTGLSWFRELGANIAAACVKEGWFDIAGFGRQGFAYPDFAKDIAVGGGMQRGKCCIACTKCTELMRFHSTAGCVVRDSKVYVPIWREATNGETMMSDKIDIHI